MALYCSSACRGGLPLKPQELIRTLQKQCDLETPGMHFRCLPRRATGKITAEDAVQKLTSDIELLTAQMSSPVGAQEQIQKVQHTLCEDVQRQLHRVLEVIKVLTDEEKDKSHGGQKKEVSEEMTDVLEQFISADLPVQLLSQLHFLEFEARKDVMNVCCALLWDGMPSQVARQVLDYIKCHQRIFPLLVEGYRSEEASLHCGVVLRSCFRHEELVEAFLQQGLIFDLIRYAQAPSIDISYDAFFSLREALMVYKEISGPWMESNLDEFFQLYNTLLESKDYVVERQALTLLHSMFNDKRFQRVVLHYVTDERNLQIQMNLLRDTAKTIQVEAFHVFKVFVANPTKPMRVQQILYKNKDRLCALLETLEAVRSDDKQFLDDQKMVIARLKALPAPTRTTSLKRISSACRTQTGLAHQIKDDLYMGIRVTSL